MIIVEEEEEIHKFTSTSDTKFCQNAASSKLSFLLPFQNYSVFIPVNFKADLGIFSEIFIFHTFRMNYTRMVQPVFVLHSFAIVPKLLNTLH